MVVILYKFPKTYQLTLLIWCFTFIFCLPFLGQKWMFSPYFYHSEVYESKAHDTVNMLNMKRYLEAQSYLSTLNFLENKNRNSISYNIESKMISMVITKKRSIDCASQQHDLKLNCEPHYLQQTLVALDKENKLYADGKSSTNFVPIIICNVDPNWKEFYDFIMVKDAFPVIYRYKKKNMYTNSNKRTQESSDYTFCLKSILNTTIQNYIQPHYILVLEDDAITFPNFYKHLFYILNYKIEIYLRQGECIPNNKWSFVKLYYPEFWAGYSLDLTTLHELGNIGLFGILIVLFWNQLCYSKRRNKINFKNLLISCIIFDIYLIILALAMSRQTLLEIRRIHSNFIKVHPAPGCCTPAVVYPTNLLSKIIEYLNSSECKQCSEGIDLALSDFSNYNNLTNYLVEPSLVQHIGMYSTVTERKPAFYMLFYDLMYN